MLAELLTVSFLFAQGFSSAVWERSPGGVQADSTISTNANFRLEYKKKWIAQFGYAEEYYDFRTTQAPIQKASPKEYSLHLGIEKKVRSLYIFGLVGIDHIRYHPRLVEIKDGKLLPHAGEPESNILSLIFGIDVPMVRHISLEFGTKVYTQSPGFRRCRTFRTDWVKPFLGIRLEW